MLKSERTTSIFGYDDKSTAYLRGTDRSDIADLANTIKEHLTGDAEVYAQPEKYFDQVIEINRSELEPHINGRIYARLGSTLSKFAAAVKE